MSDTVKLISSDDQTFEVPREVTKMAEVIVQQLEEVSEDFVPIPQVRGEILGKVIEFCKYHTETEGEGGNKRDDSEIKAWDLEFVKVDQSTLFELILAANYLNIKKLLDLCCMTVANMIKGKSPEEIRKHFGIKNDFTPEEEEEVKRQNQWAFE